MGANCKYVNASCFCKNYLIDGLSLQIMKKENTKLLGRVNITGLLFTASGGCSWPVSHFHKSGFSCK